MKDKLQKQHFLPSKKEREQSGEGHDKHRTSLNIPHFIDLSLELWKYFYKILKQNTTKWFLKIQKLKIKKKVHVTVYLVGAKPQNKVFKVT